MIQLRKYQNNIAIQAAYKLVTFGCCYLSMECRTGKTITALSTADNFDAQSVLFITKLKAIPSIKADYEALKPVNFQLDVINYESAHKAKGKYDLVIIDEAHSLGAYPKPSKRTQEIKTICEGLPVLYLSGTPSPESYSQLYHQFWVCSSSPWKEYKTFYKWAKVYVNVKQKKVNGYFINDYSHADKAKIDRDTKDLFISYSQEQAGFEVNINEHILSVPMNDRTGRYIKSMRDNLMVEIDGNAILGDTPAKLLTKLHQLSSGTVIAENGLHLTKVRLNLSVSSSQGKRLHYSMCTNRKRSYCSLFSRTGRIARKCFNYQRIRFLSHRFAGHVKEFDLIRLML